MDANRSRPDELSSWKEIASYLGVSVRTAQMWEQERGLPVRRLPGGRGQVRAFAAALDEWRESGAVRAGDENGMVLAAPDRGGVSADEASTRVPEASTDVPADAARVPDPSVGGLPAAQAAHAVVLDDSLPCPVSRSGADALGTAAVLAGHAVGAEGVVRGSWRSRRGLLGGLALVVLGSVAWFFFGRSVVPSSYRLEGNTLVITDAGGQVLWRKTFAGIVPSGSVSSPDVWFGDLDGDGRTEVLFRHAGVAGERLLVVMLRERWRGAVAVRSWPNSAYANGLVCATV